MKIRLYQAIVFNGMSRMHCAKNGNLEWEKIWNERLNELQELLPSGGGLDSGIFIIRDTITAHNFVLTGKYHHMNEQGYYDGWYHWNAVVRPSFLSEIEVDIEWVDLPPPDRDSVDESICENIRDVLVSTNVDRYPPRRGE